GARNVNAFVKMPNTGFAGCHWNGTDSSIRNAGRRTTRLVTAVTVTHLCQYVKQHGDAEPRAGAPEHERPDPRGHARGALHDGPPQAVAVGRGRGGRRLPPDALSVVPLEAGA